MTADQFMLVLCIALSLLGVVMALVAWRRRSGYGRIAQGLAVTLASIGLYLSGLLSLLWDGVLAVVEWTRSVSPNTTIWTGVSLLGAALLVWVIGAFLNSRLIGRATPDERAARRAERKAARRGEGQPAVRPGGAGAQQQVAGRPSSQAAPVDDDMAEIEAILKGRGIE